MATATRAAENGAAATGAAVRAATDAVNFTAQVTDSLSQVGSAYSRAARELLK